MKPTKILSFWIILIFFTNLVESEGQYCQNIYCNEFDYICCCSQEQDNSLWVIPNLQDYTPITGKKPKMCPTGIDIKKCHVVLQVNGQGTYFTGDNQDTCTETAFCTSGLACFGGQNNKRWQCSNEAKMSITSGSNPQIDLQPGQMVYTYSQDHIGITSGFTEKFELRRSGRSGGCEGVMVSGSVGCTFNPTNSDFRVYNELQGVNVVSQFQLNEHDCYRVTTPADKRVCGSTCDDCSSDVDCAKNYQKQMVYNGRTLGGYCANGEITLYGCQATGTKVCMQFDDLNKNNQYDPDEKCYEWKEKKGCDVVNRITTGIECCTSDECQGAGDYYCQWITDTSSKCVLKAQCQTDTDCGTATKCDMGKRAVVEPQCNGQKQCAERTIKTGIECCTTADCSTNQYCTSDYKCTLVPQAPVAVPTNPKTENYNNPVSQGSSESSTEGSSNSFIILLILLVLLILVGGGYYYLKSRRPKVVTETLVKKTGLTCKKCGSAVDSKDKFCEGCGSPIKIEETGDTCSKCGSKISKGDVFCEHCGEKIK